MTRSTRARTAGALAVAVAVAAPARAQPPADGPVAPIGTWRGTSLCADRVAAPACRDETVVYELTPGAEAGTVHWVADKIVNGRREPMGELELAFDEAEACWKAEFRSPRVQVIWCLVVDGTRLSGTARLLPADRIVRTVELRKD